MTTEGLAVTTDDDPGNSPVTALERLAAALEGTGFATIVEGGRRPTLTVTNRHAAMLTESVFVQDGWLWWSWAERLAPIGDVPGAARKLATALRTVARPPRG